MLKKHTLNSVLCAASLLFTSVTMASAAPESTGSSTTSTPPTTSNSMDTSTSSQSKDEWLSKLRSVVPAMICKNFTQNEEVNKQMKAGNIDYDKCVSLIPTSFDKCKEKYYSELPATINQESASTWGKTIGECIGNDFAMAHFSNARSISSQEITKDEWLAKLRAAVPDLICKGFLQDETLNKRLTDVNINYDKCITLIPESVNKCEKELYSQIPSTINQESASKWGHSIGECIGKDFALQHLFGNKKQ